MTLKHFPPRVFTKILILKRGKSQISFYATANKHFLMFAAKSIEFEIEHPEPEGEMTLGTVRLDKQFTLKNIRYLDIFDADSVSVEYLALPPGSEKRITKITAERKEGFLCFERSENWLVCKRPLLLRWR
jgi:hypothetical protein